MYIRAFVRRRRRRTLVMLHVALGGVVKKHKVNDRDNQWCSERLLNGANEGGDKEQDDLGTILKSCLIETISKLIV